MTEIKKERRSKREKFNKRIIFEKRADLSDIEYAALCTDISEHGIGLMTRCDLKESQIIKLFISLEKSRIKVPVFAEVVWTKELDNKIRAGLRFLI